MNTLFNYNNVWIDMHNILPTHVTFYDYNENEVPVYSTTNVGVAKEGTCFKIGGHMLPHCERFSISFIAGNPTRDIILRINPRLPQNYVVRNSRISYQWGVDEDASALPFSLRRGTDFVIQVIFTDQRYMIALNGHHFAKYEHRMSFRSLARIDVHGDVSKVYILRSDVIRYPDRLPHNRPNRIRIHSVQSHTSVKPFFSRFSILRQLPTNMPMPFYGILPPNTFNLTQQLRLEGRVKLLPWSFYVNLQQGQNVWPHPIVAFHFRCRFARHRDFIGKNMVTRTAWYNGRWAKEEVSELTTDLRPAKAFSLVMVRRSHSYEVYVNKKYITHFDFHTDPDIVDTVYVVGDIQLFDVLLEDHDPEIFFRPRASIDFIEILEDLI